MRLFKFNKVPKHQRFNYIPRYWDEAKEDLENRVRAAKGEAGDADAMKARIRGGFKSRSSSRGHYGGQQAQRQSAIRLVIIIATLLLAAYLLLSSDSVLRMVEAFS